MTFCKGAPLNRVLGQNCHWPARPLNCLTCPPSSQTCPPKRVNVIFDIFATKNAKSRHLSWEMATLVNKMFILDHHFASFVDCGENAWGNTSRWVPVVDTTRAWWSWPKLSTFSTSAAAYSSVKSEMIPKFEVRVDSPSKDVKLYQAEPAHQSA